MAKKIMTGSGGNKTRANQQAAGIPDSKPFVAPEGERLPSGVDRILKCHIDGVLVSDLNLAPQVLAALDYYATDEGVAEKNARPNVREASGVEPGAEPWDKALQQRRDDVKERDMLLTESRDPLKEVADRYAQPGMSSKYLSQRRVRENGGDLNGYQPVVDEKGDVVQVRGMPLAHIPTKVRDARKKGIQERGRAILKQITEQYKEEGGATAVADQ